MFCICVATDCSCPTFRPPLLSLNPTLHLCRYGLLLSYNSAATALSSSSSFNRCGEQFLHDGDVCNLGSINLERMVNVETGEFMWDRLRHVAKVATRMLDNVVDVTEFKVPRVTATFRGNRRLGLGIMGAADMFFLMKIPYNSPEARAMAEKVMGTITEAAREQSEALAAEKGLFPNYDLSVWKGVRPQRNAALTTVAPTGTISMSVDVSGGVEPYFALAYFYSNILGGDVKLKYVNKHLRKALEDAGCFSDELLERIVLKGSVVGVEGVPDDVQRVFVTSMDISPEDHTAMQAAFQRHTDNAISKTINFPNSATVEEIRDGYINAWRLGCKGCTVYRDGSRMLQVLNLNDKDEPEEVEAEDAIAVAAIVMPKPRLGRGTSSIMDTDGSEVLPAGQRPVPKRNSSSMMRSASNGAESTMRKKRRIVVSEVSKPVTDACPECGGKIDMSEGCMTCRQGCGWSACAL